MAEKRRRRRKFGGKYYADHGGDSQGRVFRTKGNVEMWECIYCGKRRREPKMARYRAPRIRCPECGGICQPKTAHRTKTRSSKRKTCKKRGCTNKLPLKPTIAYCDDCFNKLPLGRRSEVLNAGPPE